MANTMAAILRASVSLARLGLLLAGELSADRLEHFRKLGREARANERRHDERLRRQSERVWGQLHEEAARLRKWKEGG